MNKVIFHVLLIAFLGLLVYSNTFHAPFHFDDTFNIVENSKLRDLSNLWPPAGSGGGSRWFGYFTFAINYHLGGLDVIGYHIVNLAIHILNAILIYYLMVLTFKTPYFSPPFNSPLTKGGDRGVAPRSKGGHRGVALFSALLFVSHPIQTQAVTYIVQRFSSLATLFYLLSLVMYIKWRLRDNPLIPPEADENRSGVSPDSQAGSPTYYKGEVGFEKGIFIRAKHYTLYAVSLISAILAMKTKEIALTLPVTITLYEFMFFKGRFLKRILYLIPIILTIFVIPFSLIGINKPIGDLIGEADVASKAAMNISRLDYLFTQFRVIVTYISLLFLPANQAFDYNYPIYRSFFEQNVFLSLLFLLCAFSFAIYLFYASRTKRYALRVISFGILWFFIALSVESSIIPIVDVIVEHRIYLPSIGFFIAVTTAVFIILAKLQIQWPKIANATIVMIFAMIIILSGATYARNNVWKDEMSLWKDVIKKIPGNARAFNMLGLIYNKNKMSDMAIWAFKKATLLKPDYAPAHTNLGNLYREKGMFDEALVEFKIALGLLDTLDSIDAAALFNGIGTLYSGKGLNDKAIEYYHLALTAHPDATIYFNLGIVYRAKGLHDKAKENFDIAHLLNPEAY